MTFAITLADAQAQFPDYTFIKALTPSAQKAAFHVRDQDGHDLCLKIVAPTYERDRLDPVGFRRARHVLSKNDRVRRGAEALRLGDVTSLGRLMSASHESSRDDFENSSPALDALIEAAEAAPAYLGGKLCGAGWAGCTVNLVVAEHADAFAAAVLDGFARRTGTAAEVYVCHAADGATAVVTAEPEEES